MASCEIAYVCALRQDTEIQLPIWGADNNGNPNAADQQREAEAVADALHRNGWWWPYKQPGAKTHTRGKPYITYTKVDARHPHYSEALARQQAAIKSATKASQEDSAAAKADSNG